MAKIAVLGYGVVGSGTVEVIEKNKEGLLKKAGQEIEIKYILDLRDFPDSPYKDKFVKDFNVILNDPEISVVVEVIGGIKPSYDCRKERCNIKQGACCQEGRRASENRTRERCKLLLRGERRRRYPDHKTAPPVPFC